MLDFFSVLGAQAVVGTGSLLCMLEASVGYVAKSILKCQRQGYKSMVVKDSAVKSFLKYTDDYFDRTVYQADCRSWYKNGESGRAKIRTVWPGASSHCYLALSDPRWEDYEWERADGYGHPMAWLGNGNIPASLPHDFYVAESRATHKECVFLS